MCFTRPLTTALTLVVALAFAACADHMVGPGLMEDGDTCRTGVVWVGWNPETGSNRYCMPPGSEPQTLF